MQLLTEKINNPENYNLILGQSHFIKTVEDLYEAIVTSAPNVKFGLAFNEASGPCLVRKDGTDEKLIDLAIENIKRIGAGHTFIIFFKEHFPINFMPAIKNVREVVNIYCATANPTEVVIAETEQGRGILGVIDGFSPKGVESEKDIEDRKNLLRNIIGYKR